MVDVPVAKDLLSDFASIIANGAPADRLTTIGTAGSTLADRVLIARDAERCIYAHHYLRSDPDDPHDHPWDNVSLVLTGGYWEHTYEPFMARLGGKGLAHSRIWRAPGDVIFRKALDRHRLELEPGIKPWSLFLTGPEIREWGFWPGGKFVVGRDYRANPPRLEVD